MNLAAGRDMHVMREDTVVSDGVPITYRYCHSRRRTLGMTVRPDRSVTVRVPLRTPLHEIREFVVARAAWVQRVWERLERRSPAQPQRYEEGATFLYRGEARALTLRHGAPESVRLSDGSLVVTLPEDSSPQRLAELIDAWYRERAAEVFAERLATCHRRMFTEGVPLTPVTIRPMKSRWGSYSYRTRRITLNLNLIKLPPACLDYVIVHELCHVTVRHHGPGFWRLVARYVPDHAALRRQLRAFVSALR